MDSYISVISINETYRVFIEKIIERTEKMIKKNTQLQNSVREALRQLDSQPYGNGRSSKVTNSACYLNPYFKSDSICPPLSSEACEIIATTHVNCLIKPDKTWRPADAQLLREKVKESVIENYLVPLRARAELLAEKISNSGVETSEQFKEQWRENLHQMHAKINYYLSSGSEKLFLEECRQGRDDSVDWQKISNTAYYGERSVAQLRAKWFNDLSPVWSTEPWSTREDELLEQLADADEDDEENEDNADCNSGRNWDIISRLLSVGQSQIRSPFQCFQRWLDNQHSRRFKKYWTPEEDAILIQHVKTYKSLDLVNWAMVSRFLPGRSKFMCELRYRRTLCDTIRKGAWTATEDEYLMQAVRKYGTSDWHLISKFVPGRTNLQCRNRYENNLRENLKEGIFTLEEDERLLFGVKTFGRHQLAVVAKFLPNRGMDCIKARFRSFVKARISGCRARLVNKRTKKIEYRNPNPLYDFTPFLDAHELHSNEQTADKSFISRTSMALKIEPSDEEQDEEEVPEESPALSNPRSDGRWCMTLKGGWVSMDRAPVDPLKNFADAKRKEMCDFLNSIHKNYGTSEKDKVDKGRYERLSSLLNTAFHLLPSDFSFVGKRLRRILDSGDTEEKVNAYWPYQVRRRRTRKDIIMDGGENDESMAVAPRRSSCRIKAAEHKKEEKEKIEGDADTTPASGKARRSSRPSSGLSVSAKKKKDKEEMNVDETLSDQRLIITAMGGRGRKRKSSDLWMKSVDVPRLIIPPGKRKKARNYTDEEKTEEEDLNEQLRQALMSQRKTPRRSAKILAMSKLKRTQETNC